MGVSATQQPPAHGENTSRVELAPGPLSGFRCLDDERPCERKCRFRLDTDRERAHARWANPHGEYSPEHRMERRLDRRTSEHLPMATCAIDMANIGPLTLEQVGEQLGLTRERVRQVETDALRKIFHRSHRHATGEEITAAIELREAGEP